MKYCSQELKYILHPFWRALNFAFEDKSSEATKGRYVLEVTNHLHWTREDEVEEGQSLIGALLQGKYYQVVFGYRAQFAWDDITTWVFWTSSYMLKIPEKPLALST